MWCSTCFVTYAVFSKLHDDCHWSAWSVMSIHSDKIASSTGLQYGGGFSNCIPYVEMCPWCHFCLSTGTLHPGWKFLTHRLLQSALTGCNYLPRLHQSDSGVLHSMGPQCGRVCRVRRQPLTGHIKQRLKTYLFGQQWTPCGVSVVLLLSTIIITYL